LNEHTYISKGDDRIASWSRELGHNFKKAGDINKASEGLKEEFNDS
jgi:hypothetical protein